MFLACDDNRFLCVLFQKCCETILRIMGSWSKVGEHSLSDGETSGRGRALHMLLCNEQEMLPYCLHLLITCFKVYSKKKLLALFSLL